MKFKILLSILFLSTLVLLSGCSKQIDCSTQDNTYQKFTWDDTLESCVVSKTIPKNQCGNEVAEDGETYCNCPKDVTKAHPKLGCLGTVGNYLEKACDEKQECVLFQNDKVIEESKSLEFKNSDVIIEARTSVNTPFIINSADNNKIIIDLTLFKFPVATTNIKNLVIKELKIENSKGVLMGNAQYEEELTNIGDKASTKNIKLSDTTKYTTTDTYKMKLIISYTKESLDRDGNVIKTEDKIETLVASLGKYEVINPVFS